MYIDVIVPNFDDSSEEVYITTWYKKVGDKISNGEIIADVETTTVACGITSGYDCFLSKILVKEGQCVSQGSKIAIIETEVEKPSIEISSENEKEIVKEELEQITVEPSDSDDITETDETNSTAEKDNKPEEYMLSTHDNNLNNVEEKLVSNTIEEIKDEADKIQKEEEKVINKIAKDGATVENEVIESFSEHAEEKFMNILKDAESKAQEEANKIKLQIIEEAKKQAEAQGEELKAKILKEYEEKATKDASEMHQKIVQGSISEAENTKNKLIEEAKEKALQEAEQIRKDIISKAKSEAKTESDNLIKQALDNAQNHAKEEADKIYKNILEKAIEESKYEAKEIKKDIIHSSIKHARKESEQLIKEGLIQAKKESKLKIAEIIELAKKEATKEAANIKGEILDGTRKEIKVVVDTLLNSVFQESKEEIECSMSKLEESAKIMENKLKEAKEESLKRATEIIKRTEESAFKEAEIIKENILLETKKEINRLMESLLSSIAAETAKEAITLKDGILSDAQKQINNTITSLISAVATEATKEVVNFKDDILVEARDKVKTTLNSLIGIVTNEIENQQQILKNEISKEVNKKIEEEVSALTEEKIISDKDQKEERDNNKDISEDNIVKKLLNLPKEEEKLQPEMYADNWNKPKFFYSPDDQKENIDFLKKRIAEKMKDTYDSSVISTVSNEVDMTAVLGLEKTFGKAFTEKYNTRLGFTPFFIMAAIESLKRYRVFNAHIHDDEIIYKQNYDISVITCGNDGISAPVIRQADCLSLAEIEKKMITLSRRAVEGTLSIEEVSGGTFTVVNAGIYGSLMGTDVLTPPQVATLSVHKMHNRPIATDEGVEVKPMLYVSLSYDHRIADTKLAAEFLSNVKDYVENPGWQLLGL